MPDLRVEEESACLLALSMCSARMEFFLDFGWRQLCRWAVVL